MRYLDIFSGATVPVLSSINKGISKSYIIAYAQLNESRGTSTNVISCLALFLLLRSTMKMGFWLNEFVYRHHTLVYAYVVRTFQVIVGPVRR